LKLQQALLACFSNPDKSGGRRNTSSKDVLQRPKHPGCEAHRAADERSVNCEAVEKACAACAFERCLAATFGSVR
jgi:hypothetical protein